MSKAVNTARRTAAALALAALLAVGAGAWNEAPRAAGTARSTRTTADGVPNSAVPGLPCSLCWIAAV